MLPVDLRRVCFVICPCGAVKNPGLGRCLSRVDSRFNSSRNYKRGFRCKARMIAAASGRSDFHLKFGDYTKDGAVEGQKLYVVKHLSEEADCEELDHIEMASRFTGFQEDPMVDKLRSQLGPMHPIPTPPFNRNVAGLFVFFFMFGVIFDKLWTARKRSQAAAEARNGTWPQVPTSFSLFLEKDLKRKESVEWVNMVVGKLWKVYREGLENWIIGLLQPVIDDLKKPDYVERVEIKQFSLGEEPLSVRNVERRTSRRAHDLQYQIGLRYTGDARALLSLKLKFGIIPVVVPVGIRDFDIDGELWVKLRLIPTEPWVGAVSWAFVTLPKIKFVLSPFRLFNIMGIPVLSMFLLKLLTEDLPRLFVRPKKIVLDFQKGKALGPVPGYFSSDTIQERNRDYVGELSVTLIDARRLTHFYFAKSDPYVILSLGDQVIRSKKNSQTTVIGPPGEPIWNQDFHMLVTDPKKQKLSVQVKDSIGFTYFTVGAAEVDLGSLQDTVPTDKVVVLRGGWTPFGKGVSGEILLRLTYKAYVEDEEEDAIRRESLDRFVSDDEMSDSEEMNGFYQQNGSASTTERGRESFMDVLTALLVSEEFRGIVDFETTSTKNKSSMKFKSSMSESRDQDGDQTSESSGASALLWLAAITSITTLISINIGGASLFNP